MVVKSVIGEKQKPQLPSVQLQQNHHHRLAKQKSDNQFMSDNHLWEARQQRKKEVPCSLKYSPLLNDKNGNVVDINLRVPRTKKTASTTKRRRLLWPSGPITFILFVVISLVTESVVALSVNSTLEDDLLLMNNMSDVGASRNGNEVTTGATKSGRHIINATSTSQQIHHNFASRDHDKETGAPPLPPLQEKRTRLSPSYENEDQTTHALPVILKHGNVIYEVISSHNGTLASTLGEFSIPIITAARPPSARLTVYEDATATIFGLRVEETAKGVTYEKGASKILANSPAKIRFFGVGFTNRTIVRFVAGEGKRGTDCDDNKSTKFFHFDDADLTENSAVVTVTIPPSNDDDDNLYYVCVREEDKDMPWIHQGGETWIALTSFKKWLPLWAHIILLLALLCLSGLFSGLNLGLMAIDRTELRIIINAGAEAERRHAKKIQPLRDNGNYLLCSLLLGNVLVNATLTILLDDLTSGLIAVVVSTVAIVIFGEIVPQAVCSRHGLAVGARTVWITKIFMAITFPLSWPISVILNKVLGEEIGNVYNRERLKELIRVTQGVNDLETDEVNIIAGALELKQKTVVDVMTKLEDVYMLPIDSLLDFDTVSEIMHNGYSRIPVYESVRGNVVSLLYAKDLAFVDADDKMPLRAICEFYSNPCHFVFENVTLNVLFNVFKQGNKGHMAFVQRVKASDKSDPMYEVIGLVTLEDVIEELIQEEINDETDVLPYNKGRGRGGHYNAITDAAMNHLKTEGTTVSPQLTLAAFQYLSTAVEEFNDLRISKTVLERLLKQNIYFHIKIKNKEQSKTDDPSTILFERGKPADYFIMILEGRAITEVGKESLVFESGPFSFFGTKTLSLTVDLPSTPGALRKISQTSFSDTSMAASFIPDYTVRAITDLTYFQISRSMYQAAKQATLLEKSYALADAALSDEKLEEHLRDLEEENDDENKSSEKSISFGKSGRGSISEGVSDERRKPPSLHRRSHLQRMKEEEQVIGDNNNVAKNEDVRESEEELNLANNMSRVILCPKDERPPAELRQEGRFIVDGDDKYFCKL